MPDLGQLFDYQFMVNALEAGGVVAVMAAVVGLIFVGIVAMIARLSGSRPPNPRPVDTVSGMRSNVRSEEPGRGK